jgi:Common central domain of tyrosinase/Polyphenol oxidase middle domain
VTTARATTVAGMLRLPLIKPETALGPHIFVRRDVGGWPASHPILVSYGKAIRRMKRLPTTDPRSWTYQAAIHAIFATPREYPSSYPWNTCQHGNYFFWPWHRMYLYYFERIVRKMSGNPKWALPYWNYTLATERRLPAPFRDPSSELYVWNRFPDVNSGVSFLLDSEVDYSSGFALTNFVSASLSIEGTPHQVVHDFVGEGMSYPETAALDPIFWLHHANIDRLWNLWLAQGGGRTDPLTDTTWKTRKFTFFDEHKNRVMLTGCDVLRAAQQLGYRYEDEPAQVNEFCEKPVVPWKYFRERFVRWPIPPFVIASRPYSVELDITKLRERLASTAASKTSTLFLQLEDVVTARAPGVVWQIYLGLPETAYPNPRGPYFVGNLAMFGMGIRRAAVGKFMPASFPFAVDRAVQSALRRNEPRLRLTFVATGPLIHGKPSTPRVRSRVRIGKVFFDVERKQRAA